METQKSPRFTKKMSFHNAVCDRRLKSVLENELAYIISSM